jgi:serine/threonine protein kinase
MLLQGKSRGLLLGNYVLLEELGGGGMGVVYKAQHRGLKKIVALKVLSPEATENATALKRFRREVHATSKLHHPHIIASLDAGDDKGVHFLVMEYAEGCDLARWVKKNGPLPVGQAVDCILQAAQGLAYAHGAGIFHRDIKPSNLLVSGGVVSGGVVSGKSNPPLTTHNSPLTLKILDMGLARFDTSGNTCGNETTTDALTKTGSIMGTCDYMAPEQALNAKMADQRADVYSLGCTFYFLLTGQPMYAGETPMERMFAHRENPIPQLPGASRALQAAFARMVAKRPEDRYQSMTQVLAALQKPSPALPRKRKKAVLLWLSVAGAVAAAVLILALTLGHHTPNAAPGATNPAPTVGVRPIGAAQPTSLTVSPTAKEYFRVAQPTVIEMPAGRDVVDGPGKSGPGGFNLKQRPATVDMDQWKSVPAEQKQQEDQLRKEMDKLFESRKALERQTK